MQGEIRPLAGASLKPPEVRFAPRFQPGFRIQRLNNWGTLTT